MKSLILWLISCAATFGADYDLMIRNGRIIDGTGNPWFYGDVAMKGDRVAAIGTVSGSARREIDEYRPSLLRPEHMAGWQLFADSADVLSNSIATVQPIARTAKPSSASTRP